MFSPDLDKAINAEVTKRLAARMEKARAALITAVNSAFTSNPYPNDPMPLLGHARKMPDKKKRHRTVITPELRAQVISDLREEMTFRNIANRNHISDTTVARIKNAWVEEELKKKKASEGAA